MKYHKKAMIVTAAIALSIISPLQALADNPEFAHDEATWAKLRDNVMEYDELQMLVEEYNPNYLNNLTTYRNTKTDEDAKEIRDKKYQDAYDSYDNADTLRSLAEDYLDMGIPALYSMYMSQALSTEQLALQTEQSAESSYIDSEMKKLEYLKQQNAVIIQVQSLFKSYNQIRKSIGTIEKNQELMQATCDATERQVQLGLATQTDFLNAKKNLQSLQSTYTQTQSNLESLRQQLCIMTGWNYNDQPEIQDVPEMDLTSRIAMMNPDVDKQTALDNNYDLKYNRRALGNMAEGSADKKNMERTIKNQEENIKAGIQNLYNDVLQKKISLELAEASLNTATAGMNAASIKYQLGTISRLQYLQEEAAYLEKQVERETADTEMLQSVEAYEWALKGIMNIAG